MSTQQERLLNRFLKYVKIDTQSSEESTSFPSTEKQKDLARVIVEDLKKIGVKDAKMDDYGYVTAELPSNLSDEQTKKVPVIAFIAHMDTIPECSGHGIKPQVVKNYQGGDIVLKGDPTKKITLEDSPVLSKCIGHDMFAGEQTAHSCHTKAS